jgi:hypothetical protein
MSHNNSSSLTTYLEAAKRHGASDQFLVEYLKRSGWGEAEIYDGFGALYQRLTGMPTPRQGAAGVAAKEAFLYLLSFSTLSTWATALGSLLFTFIDQWFPDAVTARQYYSGSYRISLEMACLIVAFPVYLFVMQAIRRESETTPDRMESGVRKWLTYIALWITAVIVLCDLITFLAFFLRGELTMRFFLKVLTVLSIGGGIFSYYFLSLNSRNEEVRNEASN